MNNFETLKKALDLEVKNLDGIKSLFVMDSESNFTRNRKLSFVDVINTVITLEAGSMKDELLRNICIQLILLLLLLLYRLGIK